MEMVAVPKYYLMLKKIISNTLNEDAGELWFSKGFEQHQDHTMELIDGDMFVIPAYFYLLGSLVAGGDGNHTSHDDRVNKFIIDLEDRINILITGLMQKEHVPPNITVASWLANCTLPHILLSPATIQILHQNWELVVLSRHCRGSVGE